MNILIIQENGQHADNINYRECFCFERAFKKLNVDVLCWGKGHNNYNDKIDFNSFDVIFCLENYGDEWIPDLTSYKKPFKIFYAIDPHVRGIEPYEVVYNNKGFNKLFCAIESFCKTGTVFLPPSIDDELFYNKGVERDIGFGFVGNLVTQERRDLLYKCKKQFGLSLNEWVIGDAMVDLLNRFKISFNKNISYEGLNYRNFESIACGALLVTSSNKDLKSMGFKHGVNCLVYENIEDIKSFFPIKTKTLADISKAGEELSKKHTYVKRCEKIIKFIEASI